MRFDYQPALIDIKFFKNHKQRKLILTLIAGLAGCLILISSIARSIINLNYTTTKPIEFHKNIFLPSIKTSLNNSIHNLLNTSTENNNANNNQQANSSYNNTNTFIINNENTQFFLNDKYLINTPNANPISNLNLKSNILDIANNNINNHSIGVNLNHHTLEQLKINENKQEENETLNWRAIKIQAGDTLIGILQKLSIPKIYLKDFKNFVAVNQNCKSIHNLKSGCLIKVLLNNENDLQKIKLPLSAHQILHIVKIGPRNYRAYFEEKPIIKKLTFAHSKILGSFYTSAQSAGLNDALIMEMADIFGWDIDFSMDIRSNDKFKIIYEEKFVDQEKISTGHILVAEFINQGQKYQAVRFSDNQGKIGYYTPEGYSMNKIFLRNPVKFTRIGSRFSNSRHHPILHRIRAHKGVDYVAPSGTPVKAAGDGRVILVGYKGGYGNVIELLHGNKYTTLYAHLSNFATGIKKGQRVKQGQIIGYVGRTGLATGDHLHYEFRVDGVHRDPLTVQLPRAMPLPNRYKNKFLSHAKQMINLLNENDLTNINKT